MVPYEATEVFALGRKPNCESKLTLLETQYQSRWITGPPTWSIVWLAPASCISDGRSAVRSNMGTKS